MVSDWSVKNDLHDATGHIPHCCGETSCQTTSNSHQSALQRSARAWSRPLSTSDGDDADARATDDYAPADAASNVVDEDAPAPLLTPKQRGISKKAPPLSEKQKKKLAAQWADYVEYMDHQRTQGWKT